MRALFVVGAQRSGTTIVADCLAAQADVGLAVNGKLAYYLIVWLFNNERELAARHIRLDEVVHGMRRVIPRNIAEHALLASVDALLSYAPALLASAGSIEHAIELIWHEYYSTMFPHASVVGEKYNELLFHLPPLCDIFSDACFLFIFRRPPDVAESMVRHFRGRPWAPTSSGEALAKYLAFNSAWDVARAQLSFDRYFELSYEDFVDDPTYALNRACAHLRLPTVTNVKPMEAVHRRTVGKGTSCDATSPAALKAQRWYEDASSRTRAASR